MGQAYHAGIDAPAGAGGAGVRLADLLEDAAGLLRGKPPDPDGPPLDAWPGGTRVLALLAWRDRALADAERVWDGLDPFLHAGLQPPGEMLQEAGCVQAPPALHRGLSVAGPDGGKRQKSVASGSARC